MLEDNEIEVYRLQEFDVVEWRVKNYYGSRSKDDPGKLSPIFEALGSDFFMCFTINTPYLEGDRYISLELSRSIHRNPIPMTKLTFLIKINGTWIGTQKCEKFRAGGEPRNPLDRSARCHYLVKRFGYYVSINSNSAKPAIKASNKYSFTIVCLISKVDSIEQCDVTTQTANSNDSTSDLKNLSVFSDDETANGLRKLINDQGVQALSNNLKELYLNKEHCDVKIKVDSKEFSAHKSILTARSSVFASMFRHDMSENVNGTLDILDCEPESFEIFLKFLYTGKMDGVCYNNAISLYKTADKYSVDALKEECVYCLSEGMEAEHICNILEFAAVHEEAKLLEIAINFFIENAKDIFVTVNWQKFMFENTTLANECLKRMAVKKL